MPEMDGLEATRRIMRECPTRIVIISAMVGEGDMSSSFEAMRAGAIEVIEKPRGMLAGNYSDVKHSLTRLLKKVAQARPAAQMSWITPAGQHAAGEARPAPAPAPAPAPRPAAQVVGARGRTRKLPDAFAPEVVCIGGSTGAPTVIVEVLSALPADYPHPIVVAQHIAKGFAAGFASWLDSAVPLEVKVADGREALRPGLVLVAPDTRNMVIGGQGEYDLEEATDPRQHVPSIDKLFRSAADAHGARVLGALLSGMGRDGAEGLAAIYAAGGVTLAQSEATSVVYGMGKVAQEAGAVMEAVSPQRLAGILLAYGL
jgi:two-component system chemotaxis response regulator CheB